MHRLYNHIIMETLTDNVKDIMNYVGVDDFYNICLVSKDFNALITNTYWSKHKYDLNQPNI